MASARFAGTEVGHNPIEVPGEGESALEVVVSPNVAEVSGVLRTDKGDPIPGTTVTLWSPGEPDAASLSSYKRDHRPGGQVSTAESRTGRLRCGGVGKGRDWTALHRGVSQPFPETGHQGDGAGGLARNGGIAIDQQRRYRAGTGEPALLRPAPDTFRWNNKTPCAGEARVHRAHGRYDAGLRGRPRSRRSAVPFLYCLR